ncbi:MAG: hypothetical protein ABIA93_07150 [Candidatus Woesearchaeota archaeon]
MSRIALKQIPLLVLAWLAALPFVSARVQTGFDPLDNVVRTIARFFDIPSLRNNEYVQVGFLKLMFWIVLFTFVHYTFKKVFTSLKYDNPNRLSGIISFAFVTTAIVFMPRKWLLAQGGVVVVVLSSLIFLGIVMGILYLAFFQMNKNWLMHVFGILLIVLLYYIVGFWGSATDTLSDVLPALMLIPTTFLVPELKKKH